MSVLSCRTLDVETKRGLFEGVGVPIVLHWAETRPRQSQPRRAQLGQLLHQTTLSLIQTQCPPIQYTLQSVPNTLDPSYTLDFCYLPRAKENMAGVTLRDMIRNDVVRIWTGMVRKMEDRVDSRVQYRGSGTWWGWMMGDYWKSWWKRKWVGVGQGEAEVWVDGWREAGFREETNHFGGSEITFNG